MCCLLPYSVEIGVIAIVVGGLVLDDNEFIGSDCGLQVWIHVEGGMDRPLLRLQVETTRQDPTARSFNLHAPVCPETQSASAPISLFLVGLGNVFAILGGHGSLSPTMEDSS